MRFSASITLMFQEHAFLDRFGAARAAGFAGVEIQRLADGEPEAMARAAHDAGIEVALINVSANDYIAGGPGLSGVPGKELAFRAEVERTLDIAEVLGCRLVHLGPSRIPDGWTREACYASYLGNIAGAVELARPRGIGLLIEAMNRVEAPTALINDVDAAAEIVRDQFPGQIGLQFDCYHTAMNGREVVAAFETYHDLVRHVQFADLPGRHEPGTGRLDLSSIFDALRRAEYSGWVGAEYLPSRATVDTLGWLNSLGGATRA